MPRGRPKSTSPAYRLHKQSGQAIVTIAGRDHLLGKHGSPESRKRYNHLVGEWISRDRPTAYTPKPDPAILDPQAYFVNELSLAFFLHCQKYYVDPSGNRTSEVTNFQQILRVLNRMFGTTDVREFGPSKLEALRDEFIRLGWTRRSVNNQTKRIRAVFKWGVSKELVPPGILVALQSVGSLKKHKTSAAESEPVKPVPEVTVRAVMNHVSPIVRDMLELQLLTGMRSSEICVMTVGQIDRADGIWVYRPQRHKTAHQDIAREIHLGRRAQRLLQPYLSDDANAYLFSPKAARQHYQQERAAKRKTPAGYGNGPGSNRVAKPQREPQDRYTANSYRYAVTRGCDRAFPAPLPLCQAKGETVDQWQARLTPQQKKDLRAWQREHRFHPHQIRHTVATSIRKQFGVEAAQVALGHQTVTVTQLYAERNAEAAKRIAEKLG